MKISEEQIEHIKNIKSFDDLKEKVKGLNINVNDDILKNIYQKYHDSHLIDIELNNVTGGCGEDTEVGKYQEACSSWKSKDGNMNLKDYTDLHRCYPYCSDCKYYYTDDNKNYCSN